MNKADLEALTDTRVEDARILLQHGRYPGAYYLAGYAVECALKACIAKQVNQFDFPDKQLAQRCHTHKLSDLLGTAGLKQRLTEQEHANPEFELNWAVVKDWAETSRYEATIGERKASDLYDAVTAADSGILEWLKQYW
ncbi:HEPN domain-containing protein [Ferrimonas sp.]|uniref:HEPN domain-containing protein n=1 Tax=Ferrimonas sp. TaxID=2080861 RepID=UPI003A8D7821